MKSTNPAFASISETVETIKSTISDSYVPLFFVSREKDTKNDIIKEYLKEKLPQFKIDFINSILSGYVKPINIDKELKFEWLKDLPNQSLEMYSIVIGKKSKEEATKTYNSFLRTIDNAYNNYVDEHELLLKDIQKNITEINKVKPIIKYNLEKLAKKLIEMGKSCQVSEYDLEVLDYRNFPLKYNIIEQEKLKMEEETNSLIDYYVPFSFVGNFVRAKKLNDKTKKIMQINI